MCRHTRRSPLRQREARIAAVRPVRGPCRALPRRDVDRRPGGDDRCWPSNSGHAEFTDRPRLRRRCVHCSTEQCGSAPSGHTEQARRVSDGCTAAVVGGFAVGVGTLAAIDRLTLLLNCCRTPGSTESPTKAATATMATRASRDRKPIVGRCRGADETRTWRRWRPGELEVGRRLEVRGAPFDAAWGGWRSSRYSHIRYTWSGESASSSAVRPCASREAGTKAIPLCTTVWRLFSSLARAMTPKTGALHPAAVSSFATRSRSSATVAVSRSRRQVPQRTPASVISSRPVQFLASMTCTPVGPMAT